MSDREEQHEGQEGKVKVTDRRRFVLDDDGNIVERPDAPQRQRAVVAGDDDAPKAQSQKPPSAGPAGAPQPDAGGAAAGPAAAPTAAGPASPPAGAAGTDGADEQPSDEERMATQIFVEFLNSLAHSLLVHLGETPDPGSGLVRENLEAAQQTLEILGVLRKKTDGNLTPQEARMFDSLIYELMMRFRQKLEAKQTPPNQGTS